MTVVLFLGVALVVAPAASADPGYYDCYDSGTQYHCEGVFVHSNGEVCYVSWTDDDADGQYSDGNVQSKTCAGDVD